MTVKPGDSVVMLTFAKEPGDTAELELGVTMVLIELRLEGNVELGDLLS